MMLLHSQLGAPQNPPEPTPLVPAPALCQPLRSPCGCGSGSQVQPGQRAQRGPPLFPAAAPPPSWLTSADTLLAAGPPHRTVPARGAGGADAGRCLMALTSCTGIDKLHNTGAAACTRHVRLARQATSSETCLQLGCNPAPTALQRQAATDPPAVAAGSRAEARAAGNALP